MKYGAEKYSEYKKWLITLPLAFYLMTLLIQGCVTPSIIVTTEQNKGDVFFNQHNYSEAVKHYNQTLEASRKLGIYRNQAMESDVYRKLSNCHEMTGNYQVALSEIGSAMALDSLNRNLTGTVTDYRQQGKILIYMGLYNRGILSLEKAVSLSEGMEQSLKNENRNSIAENYLALAQLYEVIGKSDLAGGFGKKALGLFGQSENKQGIMESQLALAGVSADQGDFVQAGKLVRSSAESATELGLGTARHNQLLAGIATGTGEFENALRFQEKAINEARQFGIMGQVVWTTIGMGDIYSSLGDYARAEKYYREARMVRDTLAMKTSSIDASLNLRFGNLAGANEYFMQQGSFAGEAVSSLRIAEMLMRRGLTDSALVYLNVAEERFRNSGNTEGTSNVLVQKGKILVDRGDFQTARTLLESAVKSSDFPETAWQAWFSLGRIYEKLGDPGKAAESYRNSIAVIERIRGNLTIDEFKSIYFENKREVYDSLIRLLMKENKEDEAFSISEQARARAFYDILSNRKINFSGSVPGDLISMEQAKRTEIQKLYKLIQRNDAGSEAGKESRNTGMRQLRDALVTAQNEYEDIMQEIKLHSPTYAEMVSAQPVDPDKLKTSLDNQSAVLAFWLSGDEVISWCITNTSITSRQVKVSESELESLIGEARRNIETLSPPGETKASLNKLYSLLCAPVEEYFSPYKNLIVIPNGSLHFLPFQALVDGKGNYMVENHNIIYEPSASVYMICRSRVAEPGKKFLGMALSDLQIDNRSGLPGTDEELNKILPLFPDNISAFGKQGTETFVKRNAGNCNFIHFATHGNYNFDQPLYSYLLFSPTDEDDGRLNVYEVFGLNLNASLVTLSACETGLGNISRGDEIVGLSRAFLFAGSSSVIVSLWAVSDYPTSILMASFYKNIPGHNLQEALSMAQRELIKTYPQPDYWSPFILIGNGNVTIN